MPNLNSKQARELAINFFALANLIGEYRYEYKESLSTPHKIELKNLYDEISLSGTQMLAISTKLAMDEVKESLLQIDTITIQIKNSIKTLKDIQKVINIATTIVNLGSSIISKNPLAIATAINGVEDAWKA